MTERSRHERYLRILEEGVNGEDDYEDAKYLIDKNYLDGKYMMDYKSSSRRICSVISRGPTSSGVDYIDELIARANENNPDPISNNQGDYKASEGHPVVIQVSEKSSNLIGLAYTIIGGLVLTGIVYLIKTHFGIHL